MKAAVLLLATALLTGVISLTQASELSLDEKLQEIENKIRTNEAKMRALQGIKVYAERNNIKKL